MTKPVGGVNSWLLLWRLTVAAALVVVLLSSSSCNARRLHEFPSAKTELEQEESSSQSQQQQQTFPSSFWHRYLQQSPVDIVMESLVGMFIPALADQMENMIAPQLDPINLAYSAMADLGPVQLTMNATFCGDTSATGQLTYSLGQMTGLASLEITNLELVPGSLSVNVPLMGWFGAQESTWSGVWTMEADFNVFNGATATALATTFCNVTFEELLQGTSTITRPTVQMTIVLSGTTDNIYSFNDASTLNQATVQSMEVDYGLVRTNLGWFNGMTQMNADAMATNLVQNGLTGGSLIPMIQNAVQSGIDKNLPYKL